MRAFSSFALSSIVSFVSLHMLNMAYFHSWITHFPQVLFGAVFLVPGLLGVLCGYWISRLVVAGDGIHNHRVRAIAAVAGAVLAYWEAIVTTPP